MKQLKLGKFNILYININSIRNKLDELELNIHDIQNSYEKIIHFIALTETRIFEADVPYFNLHSYVSFHCTRRYGYGGCALFVYESLTCYLVEKKSVSYIELLTVNIIELSLNITVVYKQPTVNDVTLIDTLSSHTGKKGKEIVVGDFNY